MLDPEGLVYVETPDAMNYKNFNASPFQEFNHEHINHFSMRCLKNLLILNNFNTIADGSKIISSAQNKPYPAIYLVAKNCRDKPASSLSLVPDNELIHSIEEYIEDSEKDDLNIWQKNKPDT